MKSLCNRADFLPHFPVIFTSQHQRQINIIPQAEGIKKIKILEHKAQIFSSKCRNLLIRKVSQAFSIQKYVSGSRFIQCCKNIQKCSFSGTAFSHNCNKFTFFHRKIHIGKRLYLISSKSCGIYFFQICNFK